MKKYDLVSKCNEIINLLLEMTPLNKKKDVKSEAINPNSIELNAILSKVLALGMDSSGLSIIEQLPTEENTKTM